LEETQQRSTHNGDEKSIIKRENAKLEEAHTKLERSAAEG